MTGLEVMLAYGAYRLIRSCFESSSPTIDSCSYVSRTKPAQQIVTLVGKTGAGKSSTANALLERTAFEVGVEHGTTTLIAEEPHPEGYRLRDTPGLLDDVDYTDAIWPSLEDSGLVLYVTNGQFYRQELQFIQRLHTRQRIWNAATVGASGQRRRMIVFVNFGDVKRLTMPDAERLREADAIRSQVADWVPAEYVAFGAAAPRTRGTVPCAEVDTVRTLIRNHFSTFSNDRDAGETQHEPE
jgi:predicted GTPase